jgi:Tfp pilus assembly protein PilO
VQVKTKNLMVGAVVVLLVGLLWYTVVYSPMEAKASKAKTASHEADKSAASLRQAINGSIASKKGTKNHDVSTEVMLAAIPVGDAEASFLRSVDALRVASGADWQSITPTVPASSGSIATINIAINVQGTEVQLTRYLSGLSGLKRLFVLDNVSISGSSGPAAPGTTPIAPSGGTFAGDKLQMAVSGRIFAQPGVVPSVTGAAGTTTPAVGAPAPVRTG